MKIEFADTTYRISAASLPRSPRQLNRLQESDAEFSLCPKLRSGVDDRRIAEESRAIVLGPWLAGWMAVMATSAIWPQWADPSDILAETILPCSLRGQNKTQQGSRGLCACASYVLGGTNAAKPSDNRTASVHLGWRHSQIGIHPVICFHHRRSGYRKCLRSCRTQGNRHPLPSIARARAPARAGSSALAAACMYTVTAPRNTGSACTLQWRGIHPVSNWRTFLSRQRELAPFSHSSGIFLAGPHGGRAFLRYPFGNSRDRLTSSPPDRGCMLVGRHE